ncbi:MAG: hypothetical protein ABF649_13665 [Bacillus sp. (in: firmicutes)]
MYRTTIRTKTISRTADTELDITEKIEKDELQKFAFYTTRKFASAQIGSPIISLVI